MAHDTKYTYMPIIDGIGYDVPLMKLNRKWNFLDKYAYRNQQGILVRELIGVFLSYDVEFGFIEGTADMWEDGTLIGTATHDEIFEKLAQPVESHIIDLPGCEAYEMYVSGLQDNIRRIHDTDVEYDSLTFSLTGLYPQLKNGQGPDPSEFIDPEISEEFELTRGLFIDGFEIVEPFELITRKGDFLDRYAERTTDGVLHRDIIGTYKNYSFKFGDIKGGTPLIQLLTSGVPFHTFQIPIDNGEYYEFDGYVSGVQDTITRIKWDTSMTITGLTCDFIAKVPYLTPGGE